MCGIFVALVPCQAYQVRSSPYWSDSGFLPLHGPVTDGPSIIWGFISCTDDSNGSVPLIRVIQVFDLNYKSLVRLRFHFCFRLTGPHLPSFLSHIYFTSHTAGTFQNPAEEVPNGRLRKLLASRGPDHQAHHVIQLQIHSQSYFLVFYSTILHVRGKSVYKQPVVSHVTGNVLLFNGEVYHWSREENAAEAGTIPDAEATIPERPHNHHEDDHNGTENNAADSCSTSNGDANEAGLRTQNDTQFLFERLENNEDATTKNEDFLTLISRIKGPFSIIYYCRERRELWIGKDCLGRRSLCFQLLGENPLTLPSGGSVSQTTVSSFAISSVCDPYDGDWCEFPPNGMYCFKLDQQQSADQEEEVKTMITSSASVPDITLYQWDRSLTCGDADAHDLPFKYRHERMKGIMQSPITCSLNRVIYSQVQSLVCQSLLMQSCNQLPLVNAHERMKNGIAADAGAVQQLGRVLDLSVKRRIQLYHQLCDHCCRSRCKTGTHPSDEENESEGNKSNANNKSSTRITCDHASVAVLFSGGIDCTVIALLADRYVPSHQPIDLINVSFAPGSPDRLTSLLAHAELRSLRPDRIFHLVHADVGKQELISLRHEVIRKLIYPSNSVLDDSTGCAFFFASRGRGYLVDDKTGEHIPYSSPARVLLNGLGSDEQMAGYSRHRRILHLNGYDALNEEICREVDQLHRRNLGRDDRIISHHGKEVRYPFLDEDVISFLNSLPIQTKCDLTLERGVGEKKLLRELAMELGLKATALREKKAIQFGSRIAKLEDRKEKGDMMCDRLLATS